MHLALFDFHVDMLVGQSTGQRGASPT